MKDNLSNYSINRRARLGPELFIITHNAVQNFKEAQERKKWDEAWSAAADKARATGKPLEVKFLGMSMVPVDIDYLESKGQLNTPLEIIEHRATPEQEAEWKANTEKMIENIRRIEETEASHNEYNYLWNNPDKWLQSDEVLEGIKTDAGEDFWWSTKGFILQKLQTQEEHLFGDLYLYPFVVKRLAVDGAYPDIEKVDWEAEAELFCSTWITREQFFEIEDRFSRVHMDTSDYMENRLPGELAEALERLLPDY